MELFAIRALRAMSQGCRCPQVPPRWERWGAEGLGGGSTASPFCCERVQVAGVGSSPATETFEGPKAHGGWDWGRAGKSFSCSWHEDQRPPKFSTVLGCELLQTWPFTTANLNTYPLAWVYPPCWVPPRTAQTPQNYDTEGPGMESQCSLSSKLTSLCLRLCICEMDIFLLPNLSCWVLVGFKEWVCCAETVPSPPRTHSGTSVGRRGRLNILGF